MKCLLFGLPVDPLAGPSSHPIPPFSPSPTCLRGFSDHYFGAALLPNPPRGSIKIIYISNPSLLHSSGVVQSPLPLPLPLPSCLLNMGQWYHEVTFDQATWLGPNDRGNRYLELYLPFPWLRPLYMDWETKINNEPMFNRMVAWTPIVPASVGSLHFSVKYDSGADEVLMCLLVGGCRT